MPNSVVKSLSKKSGKSVKEVEKLWMKAKEIARQGGKKEDDPNFFPLVTGITKKMLKIGKKESVTVIKVNNDKST